MFKDELWQDIKGLSGIPIFAIIIIVSFLSGMQKLAIQLVISLMLAYAITTIVRLLYFKRRPDGQAYKNVIEKIDASSFPSLHAMRAAILATVLSISFSNNWLTVLFAFCAIGVAISRVMTKRHYAFDVIAGLILGIAVGWLATFIS
jgi:undecaprenyl-diphosphatase